MPNILLSTTGKIATLIGRPRNSRQVGYALKQLPNEDGSFLVGGDGGVPMSVQFDANDGFLDESMFTNGNVQNSQEDEDTESNTQSRSTRSNERRRGNRTTPIFHHNNVPWWRVLGSGGVLTIRGNLGARDLQAEILRLEGVECEDFRVSMKEFEWDPPSHLYSAIEE